MKRCLLPLLILLLVAPASADHLCQLLDYDRDELCCEDRNGTVSTEPATEGVIDALDNFGGLLRGRNRSPIGAKLRLVFDRDLVVKFKRKGRFNPRPNAASACPMSKTSVAGGSERRVAGDSERGVVGKVLGALENYFGARPDCPTCPDLKALCFWLGPMVADNVGKMDNGLILQIENICRLSPIRPGGTL